MLLQERCPLCMLPPPLNIFPTMMAPFHYLRIFAARLEGRKLKRSEKIDPKKRAIEIRSHSGENLLYVSQASSPAPTLSKTKLSPRSLHHFDQKYVISLSGSLSDDIIK
jgi:hypothetical protein